LDKIKDDLDEHEETYKNTDFSRENTTSIEIVGIINVSNTLSQQLEKIKREMQTLKLQINRWHFHMARQSDDPMEIIVTKSVEQMKGS